MARLSELTRAGITAATVSRLEREGAVIRLGRGLYQLPDAPIDANHTLAEAAKLVPKAVICLVSALAFHDLTDRIPPRTWMAIGPKDWRPRIDRPPIQFVRFNPKALGSGIEQHVIEGVPVRIYGPAKTIVDLFRYRRRVGLNAAIEGMRAALRGRKTTPDEIARYAHEAGIWSALQPYLEALTTDA
jgi:predicted transcriptional regulator of viral defense system